jgi:hypothetical protein
VQGSGIVVARQLYLDDVCRCELLAWSLLCRGLILQENLLLPSLPLHHSFR